MIERFTSRKEKEACKKALTDSILLWETLAKIAETKTVNSNAKQEALEQMGIPEIEYPRNHCFLCQFAKDHSGITWTGRNLSGMPCDRKCPVIWTDNNPDNLDMDDRYVPCMAPGSPYRTFVQNLCHEAEERKNEVKTAIQKILALLQKAERDIENIPVAR